MCKCRRIAEGTGLTENQGSEKIQCGARATSHFRHFGRQGKRTFNTLGSHPHEFKRVKKRIAIKREIRVSHEDF